MYSNANVKTRNVAAISGIRFALCDMGPREKLMRCYIWGTNNLEDRNAAGPGVVSFAIPDWGVQYRAAQDGNAIGCAYGSLLSLLRFVENNPKVFEGQSLEILSDSEELVEQIHRRLPIGPGELKPWTLARALREKIHFGLSWVPPEQNRAIQGVLDAAPLKTPMNIEHSTTRPPLPDPPPNQFNV